MNIVAHRSNGAWTSVAKEIERQKFVEDQKT